MKSISVFMYLIFSLDFKIKNKQTVKQLLRREERSTKDDETHHDSRDLQIRGRLRVQDLTLSFFAYSQNIDFPESFILSYFTRKVSAATFSE